MLDFKKGAFNVAVRAQVPVVPVVISDVTPFYSKSGKYFYSDGLIIAQVMDPIPTKGVSPLHFDHFLTESNIPVPFS